MICFLKPGFENLIRLPSHRSNYELQTPPNKREKSSVSSMGSGDHRASLSMVYDGTDGVILNSWERRQEFDKCSQNVPSVSHVASGGDKNIIILSPIKHGSQVPSNHVDAVPESSGPERKQSLIGSSTDLLKSTVQAVKNYGNYRNCTIVRSHIAPANYATCMTRPPKIVVFPLFVQPLDLCNPARSLVLSENLLLHEGKSRPLKVCIFIYTDLILLTKEDERGQCSVLQNPFFLQCTEIEQSKWNRRCCDNRLWDTSIRSQDFLAHQKYFFEQGSLLHTSCGYFPICNNCLLCIEVLTWCSAGTSHARNVCRKKPFTCETTRCKSTPDSVSGLLSCFSFSNLQFQSTLHCT
uniref:Uncharacterized protein n=1 Tax=Callorhinchus milii TaxID=7868 RepID=A0A4W3HHW4_CALMI